MFHIPEVPVDTDHAAETATAEEIANKMLDILSAPSRDDPLPECPEKVQSYDDAITLIQTASNICHLSKTLLKHLQFQLIKAQRDVSVMKTKCDAAEDYFRDVISLVAESGYSVSITPGREPKVTVKKVSGNTVSVVSISSQGYPTSVDVVLD